MIRKGTKKNLTPLEIAEKYVEWAAKHQLTAKHVSRILTSWPHFKLTAEEKEYIRYYAERKCPANGWADAIQFNEIAEWVKVTMNTKTEKK